MVAFPLLLLFACEHLQTPLPEATILKMVDGDSGQARLMSSGKTVNIRLYGIDAPERGQAFSQKAKAFSENLLNGQRVQLDVIETDRFGRQIVNLYLSDGSLANHRIVAAGFAWWFRSFAPDNGDLSSLEAHARAAKLGLWQDKAPLPPWEYRQKKRQNP